MSFEVIDIHTHILPEVDDGAKNTEMMTAMLQSEFSQNVRHIILTPHYNQRTGMTNEAGLHFAEVQAAALKISPNLHIYEGNEIYFSSYTIEGLKSGRLKTLAGSTYVLIEFSEFIAYDELRKNINEILLHGYSPIIAHVERCRCLYENSVDNIVDMGAFLQINAHSILSGEFCVKRFCKKLLRQGIVSFVASDCHNITTRVPNLGACKVAVEKKYGADTAERLFCSNAQQMILPGNTKH